MSLSSHFSVNCCFLSIVLVIACIMIPLMMPSPHQDIINAVKKREYRVIHDRVEAALEEINAQRSEEGVKKEANVDDIDFGSGRTSMHISAMYGDLNTLKYFHSRGGNVNSRKEADSRTPLHLAATFNEVNVVQKLVEYGAEVDGRAESGWTPLLKAVLLSNHDIVSYLLSVGADPQLHVERSFNALQCAILYSDERMIFILIKGGAYIEPGENWYDDYDSHLKRILNAGLLEEKDIPKRKFLEFLEEKDEEEARGNKRRKIGETVEIRDEVI